MSPPPDSAHAAAGEGGRSGGMAKYAGSDYGRRSDGVEGGEGEGIAGDHLGGDREAISVGNREGVSDGGGGLHARFDPAAAKKERGEGKTTGTGLRDGGACVTRED